MYKYLDVLYAVLTWAKLHTYEKKIINFSIFSFTYNIIYNIYIIIVFNYVHVHVQSVCLCESVFVFVRVCCLCVWCLCLKASNDRSLLL